MSAASTTRSPLWFPSGAAIEVAVAKGDIGGEVAGDARFEAGAAAAVADKPRLKGVGQAAVKARAPCRTGPRRRAS
jgi:hypothetical protein